MKKMHCHDGIFHFSESLDSLASVSSLDGQKPLETFQPTIKTAYTEIQGNQNDNCWLRWWNKWFSQSGNLNKTTISNMFLPVEKGWFLCPLATV